MAEGGRGLGFDRRLDAVATKKHANRQRQREQDTEEDRCDDDDDACAQRPSIHRVTGDPGPQCGGSTDTTRPRSNYGVAIRDRP